VSKKRLFLKMRLCANEVPVIPLHRVHSMSRAHVLPCGSARCDMNRKDDMTIAAAKRSGWQARANANRNLLTGRAQICNISCEKFPTLLLVR
jgi:hypothetical protein